MKTFSVFSVAALSLVLVACSPEVADTEAEMIRPVRTVVASRAALAEHLVYTGEVLPRTQTGFGFKMGGRVTERLVEVGDMVAAGDVLARLDRWDLENQLRSSEADRANALAAKETAEATLKRQQSLFDSGVIPRSRMDAAELDFNTANTKLANADAALNIVRENLEQTELRATTAGVVTQIRANVGQMVGAGEPIIVVASRDMRDAAFDIPERLVGPDTTKADVTVALLTTPDITVKSHIREMSPMADATTRTYRILVDLTDAPPQMILGATVIGTLDLGGDEAIRLPASAITSDGGTPAVYVVDPDSLELVRKPIVVSQQTSTQLVVSDGIDEGDIVVTAGVSKLRPGQIVRLEQGADK